MVWVIRQLGGAQAPASAAWERQATSVAQALLSRRDTQIAGTEAVGTASEAAAWVRLGAREALAHLDGPPRGLAASLASAIGCCLPLYLAAEADAICGGWGRPPARQQPMDQPDPARG